MNDQNTIQDQRIANLEDKLGIKFGLPNAPKDKLTQVLESIVAFNETLKSIENRLAELEKARIVQINLNSRFLKLEEFISKQESNKSIPIKTTISNELQNKLEKKNFWNKFKF